MLRFSEFCKLFVDCDAFDSEKKIDLNMRKAVILDGVVITCVNKNELLVSWKQPNGNDFYYSQLYLLIFKIAFIVRLRG